jgi:hypothetical protein
MLLKTVCLWFFTIFPEYSEKSGEFDKNRETRRLYEFSGDSRVKSGELECLLKVKLQWRYCQKRRQAKPRAGREAMTFTMHCHIKDAIQSVCKQRLCLHFGTNPKYWISTTIYIFMILEYIINYQDRTIKLCKNIKWNKILNKLFV